MEITCPACSRKIQSKADVSGRTVKCPGCSKPFKVPAAPTKQSAKQKASSADTITVSCECGMERQVPASAAGKKAKCRCGRMITVPSLPEANGSEAVEPAAFQAISDDEWQSIAAQALPPQPDPFEEEEPLKKSVTDEIMERAAADVGLAASNKKKDVFDTIKTERIVMFTLGALIVTAAGACLVLVKNYVSISTSTPIDEIEPEQLTYARIALGIHLGVGVLYFVLGALITTFPRTCTITALVLYLIGQVVGYILEPDQLYNISGWAAKILVLMGLCRAVTVASYYQYFKSNKEAQR